MLARTVNPRLVALTAVLALVLAAAPALAASPAPASEIVAPEADAFQVDDLQALLTPEAQEVSTICKRIHTDPSQAGNCESICYANNCGWGEYDWATCECVCYYWL